MRQQIMIKGEERKPIEADRVLRENRKNEIARKMVGTMRELKDTENEDAKHKLLLMLEAQWWLA